MAEPHDSIQQHRWRRVALILACAGIAMSAGVTVASQADSTGPQEAGRSWNVQYHQDDTAAIFRTNGRTWT